MTDTPSSLTALQRARAWIESRWLALVVFLVGVALHSYFQLRAGHQFQLASLYLIPLIAAPYTLLAFAALFSRTLLGRVTFILAAAGLVSFDLAHTADWSSSAKEAALGNAILWMSELGIAIAACICIVSLDYCFRPPQDPIATDEV